jgi:hypothetical protein
MSWTFADVTALAKKVVDGVIADEPEINTIATMAGILPEVAMAEKGLPILALGLQVIAQETGKTPGQVFADVISHFLSHPDIQGAGA